MIESDKLFIPSGSAADPRMLDHSPRLFVHPPDQVLPSMSSGSYNSHHLSLNMPSPLSQSRETHVFPTKRCSPPLSLESFASTGSNFSVDALLCSSNSRASRGGAIQPFSPNPALADRQARTMQPFYSDSRDSYSPIMPSVPARPVVYNRRTDVPPMNSNYDSTYSTMYSDQYQHTYSLNIHPPSGLNRGVSTTTSSTFGSAAFASGGGGGGGCAKKNRHQAAELNAHYPGHHQYHQGAYGSSGSRHSHYHKGSAGGAAVATTAATAASTTKKVASPTDGFIYQVQFKRAHKNFVLAPSAPHNIQPGDFVKVEADRGEDMGVVLAKISANQFEEVMPTAGYRGRGFATGHGERRYIIRFATPEERNSLLRKASDEEFALQDIREKAAAKGLPMFVLDAEYQFDRHKLTFYFEADGRIDFRDLVSELFSQYKTRIWMQQVDTSAIDPRDPGMELARNAGFFFEKENYASGQSSLTSSFGEGEDQGRERSASDWTDSECVSYTMSESRTMGYNFMGELNCEISSNTSSQASNQWLCEHM